MVGVTGSEETEMAEETRKGREDGTERRPAAEGRGAWVVEALGGPGREMPREESAEVAGGTDGADGGARAEGARGGRSRS